MRSAVSAKTDVIGTWGVALGAILIFTQNESLKFNCSIN
jgi:hypothetical protein